MQVNLTSEQGQTLRRLLGQHQGECLLTRQADRAIYVAFEDASFYLTPSGVPESPDLPESA